MATFEILRSRHNANHYVAILAGDASENARGVRSSENLMQFTEIGEGKPHIGFDAGAAKSAIAEHGFYAFAVTVEMRDGLD